LIALTKPEKGDWIQNIALKTALLAAGAKAKTVTPKDPIHQLIKNHDFKGFVISGGTDIHPSLFGDPNEKESTPYDRPRDEMELKLIQHALNQKLPLLCICRGAQLLNVANGGKLHTDIEKAFESAQYPSHLLAKVFFRKLIYIEENTLFNRLLGKKKEMKVNSMHKQAISTVGRDLNAIARERNGIIQAIESRDHYFALGLQFHPEFLIYRSEIRSIFNGFVRACKDSNKGNDHVQNVAY
jgi:putative glutamine amidotransferase